MKKLQLSKTQLSIAKSILAIVVLVCLATSGTLAIFTSSINIDGNVVTAGTVKVTANLEAIGGLSYNASAEYYSEIWPDAVEGVFSSPYGATSEVTEDGSILLQNFIPGDLAGFNLNIKNESNVKIAYKIYINITDSSLWDALLLDPGVIPFTLGSDKEYMSTEWLEWDSETDENECDFEFSLGMYLSAGNEFQGKEFKFDLAVYAVQANAVDYTVFAKDVADINAAAAGTTVMLINDIESTDAVNLNRFVNFDLGGHTLECSAFNVTTTSKGTMNIGNGTINVAGDFTIDAPNATITQDANITANGASINVSSNTYNLAGKLKVGGTVELKGETHFVAQEKAVLEVKVLEVKGNTHLVAQEASKLTVETLEVKGTSHVEAQEKSTLIIDKLDIAGEPHIEISKLADVTAKETKIEEGSTPVISDTDGVDFVVPQVKVLVADGESIIRKITDAYNEGQRVIQVMLANATYTEKLVFDFAEPTNITLEGVAGKTKIAYSRVNTSEFAIDIKSNNSTVTLLNLSVESNAFNVIRFGFNTESGPTMSNSTLNIINSTVSSTCSNISGNVGLYILNATNCNINILNSVIHNDKYYTIRTSYLAKGLLFNMNNSEVSSAYCAFYLQSCNSVERRSEYNINNSKLISVNGYKGSTDSFTTIYFYYDRDHDCFLNNDMNFVNCDIITYDLENATEQSALLLGSTAQGVLAGLSSHGNEVTFESCRFKTVRYTSEQAENMDAGTIVPSTFWIPNINGNDLDYIMDGCEGIVSFGCLGGKDSSCGADMNIFYFIDCIDAALAE